MANALGIIRIRMPRIKVAIVEAPVVAEAVVAEVVAAEETVPLAVALLKNLQRYTTTTLLNISLLKSQK
jgi:hypothetical protein